MAKLGILKHVSQLDFSAYGYAGASIERLDQDDLEGYLEIDDGSLNGVIRGKSLLDLALDNVDYAIEDGADSEGIEKVFGVINTLLDAKVIEKERVVEGRSCLSQLIDKLVNARISKKDEITKGCEAAIKKMHDLSPAAFLQPILQSPGIINDLEIIKEVVKEIETDVARISGLIAQERLAEVQVLINKDNYSAEVWGKVEPKHKEKMLGYITAHWQDEGRKISNEVNLIKSMADGSKVAYLTKAKEVNNLEDILTLHRHELVSDAELGEAIARKPLNEIYMRRDVEMLVKKIDSASVEELDQLDGDGYSILHRACLNGQVQLAKKLIEKGVGVLLPVNHSGMSPLHLLALSENKHESLEIFEAIKSRLGGEDITMPVLLALKNSNIELAKQLYAMDGVSEQIANKVRTEVFIRAVNSDDASLVQNFFKCEKMRGSAKFDPTFVQIEKEVINPLEVAVLKDNDEVLRAILECGVGIDLDKRNNINSYTVLHTAMAAGSVKSVEVLLKNAAKGLNVDAHVGDGELTSLNMAYNRKLVLEAEIKRQQQAEKPDLDAIKKMGGAVENIYKSMELLLEYKSHDGVGFNVNKALKADKGNSNVLVSAYGELMAARKALAEKEDEALLQKVKNLEGIVLSIIRHPGVDLNITDANGHSLLMMASINGDSGMVAAVALSKQDAEPEIDQKDSAGNTALIYAAGAGQEAVVRYLLDQGSEVSHTNKMGANALMYACRSGNDKVVSLFKLDQKEVSAKDRNGNTPLHYLVSTENDAGKEIVVDRLLKAKANVNEQNYKGETALSIAVQSGNVELAKKLMKKADVNLPDKNGNTPLIHACLLNDAAMIEVLLKNKNIDVRHHNKQGISAFLIAAQREGLEYNKSKAIEGVEGNSYPNLHKVLIDMGADPYVSNSDKIVVDVGVTIMTAKAASYASNLLLTSSPVAAGLAGNINKVINAGITLKASANVAKTTSEYFRTATVNWLRGGTELDSRMAIKEDTIMIGSVHDRGFFMKYGKYLRQGIMRHGNYLNEGGGIFTADELKDYIESKRNQSAEWQEWQIKSHEVLVTKYMSIQREIDKQPWYNRIPIIGKTGVLKQVAKDILEADKLLLRSPDGHNISHERCVDQNGAQKTFEEVFGEGSNSLLSLLGSKNSSKHLLKAMLETPEGDGFNKLNELIDKVVEEKIFVAPDTYRAIHKFAARRDELLDDEGKKSAFIATTKGEVDIPALMEVVHYADKFCEKKGLVDKQVQMHKGQVLAEPHKKAGPAIIVDALAKLLGKDKKKVVEDLGDGMAYIAGAGSSGVAAMYLDDGAMKQWIPVIVSGVGSAASLAGSFAVAISAVPVLAGVAVGVGVGVGVYASGYGGQIVDGVGSAMSWFSSSAVEAAKVEKHDISNINDAKGLDVDTKQAYCDLKEVVKKAAVEVERFDIALSQPPLVGVSVNSEMKVNPLEGVMNSLSDNSAGLPLSPRSGPDQDAGVAIGALLPKGELTINHGGVVEEMVEESVKKLEAVEQANAVDRGVSDINNKGA